MLEISLGVGQAALFPAGSLPIAEVLQGRCWMPLLVLLFAITLSAGASVVSSSSPVVLMRFMCFPQGIKIMRKKNHFGCRLRLVSVIK